MQPRVILDSKKLNFTITRLCHQLIEQHKDFSKSAIIGVQPRGVMLADRVHKKLIEILKKQDINYGKLDITFYRDDFRIKGKPMIADKTEIEFSLEGKNIILVDDVIRYNLEDIFFIFDHDNEFQIVSLGQYNESR